MKRWSCGLGVMAAAGCSLALDFDDVSDLPCPCDAQHVCIVSSNTCVRRASVDDFKACETDTDPPGGDALCKGTAICQDVNDQGPRCLPTCTPIPYALPAASSLIEQQCRSGTTCWTTPRGGVCSEGVCDTSPGSCGPNAECQLFNAAGVCFTVCEIYDRNEEPCGGGDVCHPIGTTQTTACVAPGTRGQNEGCDVQDLCRAKNDSGEAMICTRAMASSNAATTCHPICIPGDGTCGGSCILAAYGTDRITMQRVYICEEQL